MHPSRPAGLLVDRDRGRRAESPLSVWARRAVSVPVVLALAGLALLGAPLWAVCGLVVDVAAGDGLVLPRSRALGFFALYLCCEVLGVVAALVVWLMTAGGVLVGPHRYLAANAALQRVWTGALFFGAVALFSMRVEVEGIELARRGPLLLFVRHSSTADTVLAAALVANPNRLLLRYVLKRELLWDPCLDIVGRRLPNAFVDRSGARTGDELGAIARLAERLDEASAVLIYPEGTRFSPAKLAAAVARLRDKGPAGLAEIAAGYRHVLPPRLGGPRTLLEAAPGVDVVLLEHTGFEGAASLGRFLGGALVRGTVRVRLRRFAAADIPVEGRERWLFERWAEADRWIESVVGAGPAPQGAA